MRIFKQIILLALLVGGATPTAVATPQAPQITILQPANGAVVTPTTSLRVEVVDFPISSGGNHYHWFLDDVDQGPVYTLDPLIISGLTPGVHTLEVELAESDHTFIGVLDAVNIMVLEPAWQVFIPLVHN